MGIMLPKYTKHLRTEDISKFTPWVKSVGLFLAFSKALAQTECGWTRKHAFSIRLNLNS